MEKQYTLQTKLSGNWEEDGMGNNEPHTSLKTAMQSFSAVKKMWPDGEFRVINPDGIVIREYKPHYIVHASGNYNTVYFNNKKEALKYGRSITDATNHCTQVEDNWTGKFLAMWRYTTQMGGKTYKCEV